MATRYEIVGRLASGTYTMKIISYLLIVMSALGACTLKADDFFDIEHIRYYDIKPDSGPTVYKETEQIDANNKKVKTQTFEPFLEVHVSVKDQIKSNSLIGKAYFYDKAKNLIATAAKPDVADHGNNERYDWPVILAADKDQFIYFAVPDQVLKQSTWSAVVVFGDSKGVDAQLFQGSDEQTPSDFDYTEKSLVEDKDGPPIERKPAMDPVIEHVVQTGNPNQPQITLFLRPPLGMTDASQAKGVLCLSILAGNVEAIKRQLQGFEPGQDVGGILKFAEDHKLIIICWGSHGLWDPHKSWDDLSPDDAWNTDEAFDQVANAWAQGVDFFVKEYGIPKNGYLLWGMSGSAQYACRLALRKPEYFLAIHAHIPSSFDKPTREGRRILWCLTTGEQESGYHRSLRFYSQCEALGYPIIYKAVVGLGHASSPISDELGRKFFEYALSVRDQRDAYDKSLEDPLAQSQLEQTDTSQTAPWIESFRNPAYVGDVVNQDVFTFAQADEVPKEFRVPLPTKEIADAWNH
jgi:hypothetical protein